jgi:hypothetical protein
MVTQTNLHVNLDVRKCRVVRANTAEHLILVIYSEHSRELSSVMCGWAANGSMGYSPSMLVGFSVHQLISFYYNAIKMELECHLS